MQEPPSTGEIAKLLAELISAKESLEDEERRLRGSFFEEVLRMGIDWITTDKRETCPLCENSISIEEVRLSVNKRLSENQGLTRHRNEVKRLSNSLATSVPAVLAKLRGISATIFAPLEKGRYIFLISTEETLAELSKIDQNTNGKDLRQSAQKLSDEDLQAEMRSLGEAANAALEARPNEIDSFDKLTNASNAMSCVKLEFSALERLRSECQADDRQAADMKRVADHAEASRKKVVAEVVANVAELANQYFRKIHPDEGIGSPSLEIAKVGTASLNLTSEFYSKVGDPRGLYSEGHIDSLGLCLFLAIRKMHHGQCRDLSILVLDDVLHSVDGHHRKRTAELIFDEFSDHQLIVTTHDPIWCRYLCQKAQRCGRPFTMKRIAGWSLAEGPKWGDHLADYEWLASPYGLRALPKDRASKAGTRRTRNTFSAVLQRPFGPTS